MNRELYAQIERGERFGWKPMPSHWGLARLGDYITPAMRERARGLSANEWIMPYVLDQGQTPHCVGFAWTGWGICNPVHDPWQNADGHAMYYDCKVIDGEPNAEDGSFTSSGAKVMQNKGRLKTFAFATQWADVQTWLLVNGPVVTGTNWYSNMTYPDASGLMHASGTLQGGHDYLVMGIDTNVKIVKICNSWGDWGPLHGFAYLSFTDFELLQSRGGDCCTAVELPLTPTTDVASAILADAKTHTWMPINNTASLWKYAHDPAHYLQDAQTDEWYVTIDNVKYVYQVFNLGIAYCPVDDYNNIKVIPK